MKIAILGYGKMGEQVEIVATERGHQIVAYIDDIVDWEKYANNLLTADVAIDFSMPSVVLQNIDSCFERKIPIVVGTTGWYDQLSQVKQACEQGNHSLLYASNFSLGVNLFFALNIALAKLMNPYKDYDVSIEEIHHVNKKDAPSGTAITLANDIINVIDGKECWINEENKNNNELSIKSERKNNDVGTHIVNYKSKNDSIEIKHISYNRRSFAVGAVLAAEWLIDKKGFFTIRDMLNIKF